MNKYIVITSVNEPTPALVQFTKKKDWKIVVVADKKTPEWQEIENVTFLSLEKQEKLSFELVRHMPFNHYCRKMIGYLYAMSQGADCIYDTDDDNIPNALWDPYMKEVIEGHSEYEVVFNAKWINIYNYYTDSVCWPRGYPLCQILKPSTEEIGSKSKNHVGIWQFLADDDPDVDAIYRLTNGLPVKFKNRRPLILNRFCYCPFNSQNTLFFKKFFPLLYLPAFVSFRFTDILRGIVAQPVLWFFQHCLGFGPATVYQERNEHHLMQDFEQEIPMYLNMRKIVEILDKIDFTNCVSAIEILGKIYESLERYKIVTHQELTLLSAWEKDLDSVNEKTSISSLTK